MSNNDKWKKYGNFLLQNCSETIGFSKKPYYMKYLKYLWKVREYEEHSSEWMDSFIWVMKGTLLSDIGYQSLLPIIQFTKFIAKYLIPAENLSSYLNVIWKF